MMSGVDREREGSTLTIKQGINDELAVLLHEVVDVAKDSTNKQ
jgi:Fe-S cluster biogenesis protein NfuA